MWKGSGVGETNEEFVVRIMNFCPYGALIQLMVIEALRQYAELAATKRLENTHLIAPDAWQGCAVWLKGELASKYGGSREAQTN